LFAAAQQARYALAAFNVSNLETTQAVIAAAEVAAAPVVLQVSPGAIDYAGYGPLTRLVMDLADAAAVPIVVHLDHCREPGVVERALDDGYDSVMFDGSRLELAENIRLTSMLVQLARRRAGVTVEAELGLIGGREDGEASAGAGIVRPEDAASFASATGIDVIAPALGNLHRMPDDSMRLDPARIREIAAATGLPIALHGASGIERGQLPELVAAGITKVNISSQVSRALAAGIRDSWAADGEALDLRRFIGAGRDRIREMATEYIGLTGGAGRAATAAAASGWSERITEAE
jgi:ketose-bisphosphate aldolase